MTKVTILPELDLTRRLAAVVTGGEGAGWAWPGDAARGPPATSSSPACPTTTSTTAVTPTAGAAGD